MLPTSGLPRRMCCPAGEGALRVCSPPSEPWGECGREGFLCALGSARRDLSTPSSDSVLSPSSAVAALLPGPCGS